jgi:CubicO group peptidase (beta-lactamase class C family)
MNAAPAPDFAALHAAMQRWVDGGFLAGVSIALWRDGAPVHLHCTGQADRERGEALREDHLFRLFSSSKLFTSIAALLLMEDGRLDLDDAVERFLPGLAARRVLRTGSSSIDDTEPAQGPITIAQLMSHSAGLAYGLLDPGSLLYEAYTKQRILARDTTLEQMVQALAPLPLAYQPGTGWQYSIATDVLARVVEVAGRQRFDRLLHERLLEPLGMADTGFVVPEAATARLAAMYVGVKPEAPLVSGLVRGESLLHPGANLVPTPRLSGGGGLVSSLPDTVKLLRALRPGPRALLKESTLALLPHNRLPAGCWRQFPDRGVLHGRAHGLAGGLVLEPGAQDDARSAGEIYWGGMAGTQWWIAPRLGLAGALMTQRFRGYGDPFVADLKREAYRALLGPAPGA